MRRRSHVYEGQARPIVPMHKAIDGPPRRRPWRRRLLLAAIVAAFAIGLSLTGAV